MIFLFQGKFKTIESGNVLTTSMIVERIIANRQLYSARNAKKEAKELAYIEGNQKKNSP